MDHLMNLLFDLDGTLTDPAIGITRCIQHALVQLGLEPPPYDELTRFIGPPLQSTFAELLAADDESRIAHAIALYRERYQETGMFENRVYSDVPAGLEQLIVDGHRLWVATSKPRVFAEKVIEHFQLGGYFRAIYGSELDGSNTDKSDLIRGILEQEQLSPADTWMIGDRAQDIRGGRANGLKTLGVLWGYGSDDELRGATADSLARDMAELILRVQSQA